MRSRGASSDDLPVFPIGPVLVNYGGAEPVEGLGEKAYRCPFHKDSDASASVNTSKQLFNCHAGDCPKGGAVAIIMQVEGISYGEALERAATISGESVGNVQPASGRRGRMAGGSRGGSGTRSFKRTWRSS